MKTVNFRDRFAETPSDRGGVWKADGGEALAAEEAATAQRRTRAVGVEQSRVLVELKRVRKSEKSGASSRFLNSWMSGGTTSCNMDLEWFWKTQETRPNSAAPKPEARGAHTHTANPLSRAPTSLAVPSVPADGLGFPFLTCCVSPPSQAHGIALCPPESSLVPSRVRATLITFPAGF